MASGVPTGRDFGSGRVWRSWTCRAVEIPDSSGRFALAAAAAVASGAVLYLTPQRPPPAPPVARQPVVKAGSLPETLRAVLSATNVAERKQAILRMQPQNNPLDTLRTLNDDPALLSGREGAAAGLFARADVRDAGQKTLLADYLLSPGRSLLELEAFAGLYPNENFMISHSLLTPSATLSNAELLSRCQAAQQTVGQWLQDSRFAATITWHSAPGYCMGSCKNKFRGWGAILTF